MLLGVLVTEHISAEGLLGEERARKGVRKEICKLTPFIHKVLIMLMQIYTKFSNLLRKILKSSVQNSQKSWFEAMNRLGVAPDIPQARVNGRY